MIFYKDGIVIFVVLVIVVVIVVVVVSYGEIVGYKVLTN